MALVVKDQVWPSLNYDPHQGQQLVHHSLARHRVAAWGRRAGKSTVGGRELMPEVVYTHSILPTLDEYGKSRIFWLVGPDYSDCEKEFRVFYNDLRRIQMPMDRPGTYYIADQGNMQVSLFKGKFLLLAKSAKYLDSLDGEGLCGVELVEAAKLKPIVWGKYIRPALADEKGWSLQTSTPEGKNWFYRHWQRGQDPKFKWDSWRFPSWINDQVFPGGINNTEIQEMKLEMSDERFNQEVAADFTEFVGRVFKEFDEEVHVGDYPWDPTMATYLALDYGWTNPFVVLIIQTDVFDNVYVVGEYRVVNRDINDVAKDLMLDSRFMAAQMFYPDPARPDDTAVLERALRIKANADTGGELKNRLEAIRHYLKYDPASEGHPEEIRKPKLFIDRRCNGQPLNDGGLIREMQDYRYPDTKEDSLRANKEEPMDKDDHGPEALGRFFRGHYGPPGGRGTNRAKINRAVMRSGKR